MSVRGGITTNADVQRMTLSAVVLNADGTVKKNLGEIAYHDKSKWKTFFWYVRHPKQALHWIKTRVWRPLWQKMISPRTNLLPK